MPQQTSGLSPVLTARLAGGAWLVVIAAALFAEVGVRGGLVVSGEPAQTAANLLANPERWRQGFAADLVSVLAYVAVTLLLQGLLRAVSRGLSMGAAVFGLMGSAVMAINLLGLLSALYLLQTPGAAAAFTPAQLAVLASVPIRLHGTGYHLALVFFGLHLALMGVLILRSTFLPRLLGLLLIAAGTLGVARAFMVFLALPLAGPLYPFAMGSSLLAEGGLALWLVAMAVNAPRWLDQARATAAADANP